MERQQRVIANAKRHMNDVQNGVEEQTVNITKKHQFTHVYERTLRSWAITVIYAMV